MQLASWISPLHRLFGELRSFIAHFAWLSGPTLWPRPAKLMNPLGGSRGITPFLATSRSGQCDASHRTVSSVSGSAREGQPPDIHPRGLRSAGAAAAVCDVYNYASAGQHWRNEGCISDLSDEKVRHVGTRDGPRAPVARIDQDAVRPRGGGVSPTTLAKPSTNFTNSLPCSLARPSGLWLKTNAGPRDGQTKMVRRQTEYLP